MGRRTASSDFLTPIKSDGTRQTMAGTEFGRGSFTLAVARYLYPLASGDARVVAVQVQWDATFAGTIQIDDCNFPEPQQSATDIGTAPSDGSVTWYSTTNGEWITEQPSSAYVAISGGGGDDTATNGVVTVVAGTVGGCMFHVVDTGARRTRLNINCTTGGEVRVATWGKE